MRVAAAAGVCAAAVSAWAAPALGQEGEDFGLSGDWSGARSKVEAAGWTFQISETAEAAGNLSGGEETDAAAAGQLTLGATADLEKLAGVSSGTLQVTLTERHGASLTGASGLSVLQPPIEVHGRGDIWRLTEFWWRQSLADGAAEIKLGRVNPGSDFASFPCDFQNLTFCGAAPGNIVGDYWHNWPVSQWGARMRLNLGAAPASLSAGAYRVSQENLDEGFALTFDGEGVLYPLEAAWTPKLGEAGRPGEYKLTAWYATTEARDVQTGEMKEGQYGASLVARQQVSGPPDGPGVTLFLRAVQADRRTARLDRQVSAGAVWRGPFERRPDDAVAIAVGATHVNARAAGAPSADTEIAAELDYRLQAPKGLTVTPNLQYVRDPGGIDREDAVILGLKIGLTL